MTEPGRCPVCQARFRGSAVCSRCGADLAPLMILAVNAWKWRGAARNALGSGQFERAFELAAKAQEAQGTPEGEALRAVTRVAAGLS